MKIVWRTAPVSNVSRYKLSTEHECSLHYLQSVIRFVAIFAIILLTLGKNAVQQRTHSSI